MNIAASIERGSNNVIAREALLDPALECVLSRVRLRAQLRVAWLRKLWSEEEPPGGKFAITHGEVDTHLQDKDSPEAEAIWMATDSTAVALTRELEGLETAMAAEKTSRLAQLQHMFQLNQHEYDLFQACLAVALDPSLTRVYAYIQDQAGRGYVTEELAGRLFGHGRRSTLSAQSPLLLWALITQREVAPGEPALLTCDPVIRDWLCGKQQLDECLVGIVQLCEPLPPLENWPVAETAAFAERVLDGGPSNRLRVRIVGAPGSGRRTLAACISARLGLKLQALDTDQIVESDWPHVFLCAQRQALLNNNAVAWCGENALRLRWPHSIARIPPQFVICDPGTIPQPNKGIVEYSIEMPILSLAERRELWRHYVPTSVTWDAEATDSLMARHRVSVELIAGVARSGVRSAKEAGVMIRDASRERLGGLIEHSECPFTWEDLIVPSHVEEALNDLVFEATDRAAFWEDSKACRLYPKGRGLFALFSGSPGVGKTMGAQIIAAALQRDLYCCDISAVVSRWVGETAKAISRILNSVPNDEVLLFDEADALFGKRVEVSDSNSRFLNTDTSHLLQAVERYRGVVILATNKKSDIDTAFLRRLRYVIDIPKPDTAARLQIWRNLIGELAGEDRLASLEGGLRIIANEVETTGAQIKFAVLSALFIGRQKREPLNMKQILRGLERELRKEGCGWSERERERLMRHGS